MSLKRKPSRGTTDSEDLYLYREGALDDEEFVATLKELLEKQNVCTDFLGDLDELRSLMNEPVRTICYHVSPSRSWIGIRFRLPRHYWRISGLGLN